MDEESPRVNEKTARERFLRIKVSLAAYAYDHGLEEILTDAEFDQSSKEINPQATTIDHWDDDRTIKRREILDKFFREEFHPDTGQWIHKHPELQQVRSCCYRVIEYKRPRSSVG